MGRRGKMTEQQINSKYLQETMTLKIYQSENFSSLYKQHLCIMQDGNDYFQMGRAATIADKLQAENEIENTVFVGIHYKDKFDRREKYHPSGAKQASYIQFLVREVVPFLDDLLPTYSMGQARTLMGDSLAGTLALVTALKYPHTFSNVIMQSPYVDSNVLQSVNQVNTMEMLNIYHTIGSGETNVTMTDGNQADFLLPNRKLNEAILKKHTSYSYHELSNGLHTWKYWQKDLPNALKYIFGVN